MDIRTITYNHTGAPERLADALSTSGLAIFVDHPTDQQLVLKAHNMWDVFFRDEDKTKYAQEGSCPSGYFSPGLHPTYEGECYHYFPWVPNPQGMNEVTRRLFDHMGHLSHTFLGWIESEMPNRLKAQLKMPLPALMDQTHQSHLVVVGEHAYNPSATKPAPDQGFLTLLFTGSYDHFRMWDSATASWHNFSCPRGSLLVSAGGALDSLSGGLYSANAHALLAPAEGESRTQGCLLPFFAKPGV